MAETSKKENAAGAKTDVALVYSRSDDGKSYGIVRRRDDEVQLGTLSHLEHGKSIHGELVRLRPRQDSPALFDVETQQDAVGYPEPSGPAKVSSAAYRRGWDSIWSSKAGSSALN